MVGFASPSGHARPRVQAQQGPHPMSWGYVTGLTV